jgi:lipopolysaccharide/colanic/teichoic acid biosynthesis glycosyltransferase
MTGYPELSEITAEPDSSIFDHARTAEPVGGHRGYEAFKRTMDITIALLILLLLLPVIPVIVLLIKLDSPGPILFRQRRVGRDGKEFDFFKFRSMHLGAENVIGVLRPLSSVDGPVFKLREDPRVTGVGRFLRRSSLDELPQLLNVLKGEMSIVGPRPNLPSEVSHYLPWQRRRLDVTPGITCFWQIAGRSHIGFQEWMRLDLEYIRKRSIATDIKIMLKTIPAVIARKGAY